MAVTKLTEFKQAAHIVGGGPAKNGICYYICNYVEQHKDSPWLSAKNFEEARVNCTRMRTVPLVAAGKAGNLQQVPQAGNYNDATPLRDNSIYRCELAVGLAAAINHETAMLTGENEIILFDPNFGFYHVDVAPGNHHEKFEQTLTALYGATPIGLIGYKRIKKAY
jgi:hypothetical protein